MSIDLSEVANLLSRKVYLSSTYPEKIKMWYFCFSQNIAKEIFVIFLETQMVYWNEFGRLAQLFNVVLKVYVCCI